MSTATRESDPTPPPPAAPASPITAAPAISEWLLSALATPALIHDGEGVVSMGPRVWTAWATHACRGALSQVLGRPVAIEPGGRCGELTFAADLTVGGEPLATVGLDLAGARIIADALSLSLAGVRGAGPLSATEAGLVEFAALDVLDRVLSASFETSPVVLAGLLLGEAAAQKSRSGSGARIPLRITVAGRTGGGLVVLHSTTDAMPPLGPSTQGALTGQTQATLALPAFALAREELASLSVGDLVLPGLSKLADAAGCGLVTRTLWRLCSAMVASDAATHIDVACGPIEIAPDAVPDAMPEGHIPATIHIGDATISHEELRGWASGRTISLKKTPGREATLIANALIVARGELVMTEGAAALRINQLVSPTEQHA